MTRRYWIVWLACSAVMGGGAWLAAQSTISSAAPGGDESSLGPADANADGQPDEGPRLRESMRLSDAPGHFESATDVPVFVDETGRRLTGLENLNLQRIGRTVRAAEDPARLRWKVTGTITEYEGRNYILIERAVYTPTRR